MGRMRKWVAAFSALLSSTTTHADPKPTDKAKLPESQAMNPKAFAGAVLESEKELTLVEFVELQKKEHVTVIDVRGQGAFAYEHVKGSTNLALTELTEKTLPVVAPDKKAAIALVCDFTFAPTRMVSMTMQAYPVLRAAGYTRVYRLNFWQGKGGTMSRDELVKLVPLEGTAVTPDAKKK